MLIIVSLTFIKDTRRYYNIMEEITGLSGNAGWKSISNINQIINYEYDISNIDSTLGKLTLFTDIALKRSAKPPGI